MPRSKRASGEVRIVSIRWIPVQCSREELEWRQRRFLERVRLNLPVLLGELEQKRAGE